MRFYTEEGRIAEERRIRRTEENEHVRLCNAGISQTVHVWESEEAKAEFMRQSKMGDGRFNGICNRIHERMRLRETMEARSAG